MGEAARFCDQCGSPVASATALDVQATRKIVTVLFADLVGSTSFGEQVDAESMREAMAEFHAMVQRAIDADGGTVAKFIGDGVMALFGVPETAEDDADRAVAAGLQLQQEFVSIRRGVVGRHGIELGLRVGINTGEIVLADGDADVVGDVINTAARLEAACAPGQVLVGEDTWRLTRAHVRYEVLGEVDVNGKSEPVATFRVADDPVHDDDGATPFVGRAGELKQLRAQFEVAVELRSARLATVIGAPGVGKTRIAREFAESIGEAAFVAQLRCERAGTATFAPIAELLRSVTSIGDESDPEQVRPALRGLIAELDDADRVADLLASFLGAAPARSTEEAFLAVRRLVEATGRQQPLVVVVDDIQWAEPLFLDLLEHLVDWVHDAPALLVGLARPELRELRPSLAEENRTVAMTIGLEGLDAAATSELAARLLGAERLPSELVARLPESTEGNPLFVRELMRMLVDDGIIVETADGWQLTIDVEAVEVPPTIQSLLAARLDRMPADERRLIELASVVGPEFALGAVGAISETGSAELRLILDRLRRRELIESTGVYWGDEAVYRFHHVLIRDAAYRRLLKRRRAALHLRVGEWTEQSAAELPGEHEVAIAHHFEQAHEYHRQLDDIGESMTAVGRKAADLLGVAAGRSLERDDLPAASALAERALARLDEGDSMIPPLLVVAAESLLGLGDVTRGRAVVDRLVGLVGTDGRLGPWAESFVAQLTMLTEPDRLHEAEEQADLAATRLAELGDESGVAKARLVRAGVLARLGQVGRCETELDEALTAARSADDRRRVAAVLGAAPLAALWGPSPIPRAGGRCLDVIRLLRITTGSPAVEATSVRCQAVLEALRGRFDTARTMLADARATVEELGLRHALNETDLYTGIVELLAGDAEAAEAPLRAAYQGLGRLGIGADTGQAAAYLSRALLQLGRVDEAEELAAESAELAGENPQTAIAAGTAQAEILAAQGRHDEAVVAASDAVARAQGTDIIVDHAAASAVLARVAGLAGDAETAERAARMAADLYQQKAATVAEPTRMAVPEAPTSVHPATADENRASRLAQEWLPLWISDEDAHFGRMADHVVAVDHRSVVRMELRGRDQVREAFGGVDPTGRASLHTETLAVRGDDLVLTSNLLMWARGWDGPVVQTLSVLRWTDDDRVDVNLCFDIDDLDGAEVELDRLHRDSQIATTEPRNEADRLTRRFVEAFTAGAREEWLPMLSPDQETIDRRPLGFDTTGADGVAAAYPRDRQTRAMESAVETIAVRGDTFALVRWKAASTHGREWDGFHLTRWTTEGLNDLNVIFPPDQLNEALAELDRLFHDELGDSIAGLHASHEAHRPRNGADRLMREFIARFTDGPAGFWTELIAADGVFDDRTPVVGHEPVGKDALITLWPRDFEPGDMVATVETIDTRGNSLALTRWVATANNDEAAEWDTTWVTRWNAAGQADLLVRYSSGQVNEAAAELDRLDLAEDRGSTAAEPPGQTQPIEHEPWNEADRLARRLIELFFDMSSQTWSEMLDPGHVSIDRQPIVAHRLEGRDASAAIWTRENMDDDATSVVETIATRGDHLALHRWTVAMGSGRWASETLNITRWNERGLADLNIRFAPEDLHTARAELDRLWFGSLSDRRRIITRLAVVLGEAWVAPSTHPFDDLLSVDFEFVDGRTLGMGTLDRAGFEAALRGREADGATGTPVPSRVTFVSDNVMVFRANNLGHAPDSGVDWEEIACNVLVTDGDRIARLEMFDEDRWTDAITRGRELTGPEAPDGLAAAQDELDREVARAEEPIETPTAVELPSPNVQRLGQRVVDATVAGDFETVRDCFEEDFVRSDRRRMIGLPDLSRDEYVADLQRQWELGWRDYRTVAVESVRSNGFVALLTTDFEGGSESPFRVLLVEGSSGRIGRLAMYDEDDVQTADDDLDEAWLATLDPVDAETYRVATGQYRAYVGLDGSRVEELTAPGLVFTDHRRLGNFGQLDRAGFLELFEARRDTLGPGVGRVTAVHFVDRRVVAFSKEEYTRSARHDSDTTSAGVHVVRVVEGSVDLGEIYDDADRAAAVSRAEALADPGAPAGGRLLDNCATRWVERVVTGDRPTDVDAFAEDFVRFDGRSTVAAEPADRDQFVEGLRVQHEMGVVWSSQVVAIRGDRFGLCRLTSRSGSRHVEFLATIEVDDAGRAVRAAFFDRDDPSAATEAMSRSWAATLPRELLGPLRVAAEYERVGYTAGLEGGSFFADDAVVVDHRSVGLGASDLSEYLRLHGRRADDGPVTGFAPEVIPVGPHVLLFSNVNTIEAGDGASWEEFYFQVFVARGGKIARLELFAEDQRDAALRRARELASPRSLDAT